MYLFSRVLTTMGSPRQVLPWVTKITEHVNANSSLGATAWMVNFGRPLGTVAWSAIVESQSAMAEATAELLTQDAYFDLIESGAEMVAGPGADFLREVIHGEPSGPPPLGAVGVMTTATAAVDRMVDAVTWSVDIARHVEHVTGTPVAVLLDSFGTMGSITWLGIADDLATTDANAAKINADADYIGKLASSAGLFIPGSGYRSQVTRIA